MTGPKIIGLAAIVALSTAASSPVSAQLPPHGPVLIEFTGGNQLAAELVALAEPLGLLQQQPEVWLQGGTDSSDSDDTKIDSLIAERTEARANKDWARSDALRDELTAMGISLEDTPNGTIWRRL